MNNYMDKNSRIYISGHNGFLGSTIKSLLEKQGYKNIITATRNDLNLENQTEVEEFFRKERPEYVFHTAAMTRKEIGVCPADAAVSNIYLACNVIKSAFNNKVKKLLYISSSWIYPRDCIQPITEDAIMTGPLETMGEGYSFGKLAGVKICQYYNSQYNVDFISGVLCNIYGPQDHFDGRHVVSGLIQRFYEAKKNNLPAVEIWGTGNPRREFMYIKDAADTCVFLMNVKTEYSVVNINPGLDYSIKELAQLVMQQIGFHGELLFDLNKHDGIPKRLLDNRRLKQLGGGKSFIPLEKGLEKTLEWYTANNQ
jgi:GDP-L-fucose synthase